jgi:outer membrane protein
MRTGGKILAAIILCAAAAHPALAKKAAPKKTPPAPVVIAAPEPSLASVAAEAFPLSRALAAAYVRNPDLDAARAELRATDEQYAQAVSGFRPSLSADASYDSTNNTGSRTTHASTDPKALSLTLTQPIYSGGSTLASMHAADNTIMQGRARLLAAEQAVLLSAVASYMDVLRDRQIVDLDINNEKVLKDHLTAAREQFKLGAITRTDVSQSEARLAAATAARISAQGTYKVSRAGFEKTMGLPPEGLVKPVLDIAVPGTMDEAVQEAGTRNPALLQARYAAAAAHDSTRVIEANLLPTVSATGSVSEIYDPGTVPDDRTTNKSVLLQASIPIFGAGGADHSRVRQAKQVEDQRRREQDSAERAMRQSVIDAWETLAAANAGYQAQVAQVAAEKMAREGVRIEQQYGSRTVLNYLDAEQEYLNAEVARVSSERDKIVATYGLLAAMGHLTAADLKLDVPLYDPVRNFQNVKGKWAGLGINDNK